MKIYESPHKEQELINNVIISSKIIKLAHAHFMILQSLFNAVLRVHRNEHAISEFCYKGTILQRNYKKMTTKLSFSCNSSVKFHGKKIGSHNMTVISKSVL